MAKKQNKKTHHATTRLRIFKALVAVKKVLFRGFSHSIGVCLFVYFFMSFFLWHRIVFLFYLLQGEEGSGKYFPLSSSLERKDLYKCQHSSSLISSIKKRNLAIFERPSLPQLGFEPETSGALVYCSTKWAIKAWWKVKLLWSVCLRSDCFAIAAATEAALGTTFFGK